MTRPHRGYTDGPFGQIHYQDTGGDGEPLILCHQAPITSRQFDLVYPLLAAAGIYALDNHVDRLVEDHFLAFPAAHLREASRFFGL